MHGFEIANAIQELSEDVLQVEEGSLYPALQRMLIKGWLSGEWGKTSENRRARYYRMTASGRRHLEREGVDVHRLPVGQAAILANLHLLTWWDGELAN